MKLDDAIATHVQWKIKLRRAIAKREKLDASTIRKDDACELGQWLRGAGQLQHGHCAAFPEVVRRHAEFHEQAALVAAEINAGHHASAARMLDRDSAYWAASSEVGISIVRLKKEIGG